MKNIIITVIITSVVLVTGYFVYTVIKMQKQLDTNTKSVEQIVNFLNSQIKQQTPTQ